MVNGRSTGIRARIRRVTGTEGLDTLERETARQARALERQRERLAKQRDRIDRVAERTQKTQTGMQSLRDRVSRLGKTVDRLGHELKPELHGLRQRELDHHRSMQQLAALEQRVGRIEERLDDITSGVHANDDASLAEARSLVDAVRREHDQARVRFQIVSAYEERLRRLEGAVMDMYDGELRRPL